MNELRSIDLVLELFSSLIDCNNMFTKLPRVLLSLMVYSVIFMTFSLTLVKIFFAPWEHYMRRRGLNAIAMLQHGHSTCELSNLLGISQSTCFRICKECVPHVEPSNLVWLSWLVLGEGWRISMTSSSCDSNNRTCRWWIFCALFYDFMWHELHLQDEGEDDTSLVYRHSSRRGSWRSIE